MSKLKKYLKREVVQAAPAFNIGGEIYLEDDANTPTITNPSQEGFGIHHIMGENLEWETKEDFEELYVPWETPKDRLICLRDEIKTEIDDTNLELKLSRDDVDLSLMRIEVGALITCYKVLEERISRMK